MRREDSDPDGRAGAQGAQGENRARHGVGAFDGGIRGRCTPPWRRRLSSLLPAGFVAEDPGVGSGARLLQAVVLFVDRVGVLHFAPLLRRRSFCFLLAVPLNFMLGVSTLPPSPYEVSSPCTPLVDGSWEPKSA